jgi:hypothetical protein
MMPFAFEVQHGVDDVLERLGPGEAAVFRDVADEKGRHVASFRSEQQLRCRFAHLSDAAGRRLELERKHRLDGVDDDQRRLDARNLVENALEARFGEQIQRRVADGEPLAARFDLVLGFLARAVENGTDRSGQVRRRLQQQRRLADARLAPEQHERPGHDAAAEHAIELADAGGQPRMLFEFDLGVEPRPGRAGERVAMVAGRRAAGRLRAFFDERVPRAALEAAPLLLRRLRAALLTDEDGLCLHVAVGRERRDGLERQDG